MTQAVRATPTGQKQRNVAPPSAGVKGFGADRSGRMATAENPVPVDATPLRATAYLPLPGSTPVLLVDRKDHGCKWPVGESPFLFCNEAQEAKPPPASGQPVTYHPYCPHHRRMATSRIKS